MHKIRLATLEDAGALVRLRMTFLEEVGQFAEGVDAAAVAEAFRNYSDLRLIAKGAGRYPPW